MGDIENEHLLVLARLNTVVVSSLVRSFRQIWALLAKEVVFLGDYSAATTYLAAAQRHNDAFDDKDNVTRREMCRKEQHLVFCGFLRLPRRKICYK